MIRFLQIANGPRKLFINWMQKIEKGGRKRKTVNVIEPQSQTRKRTTTKNHNEKIAVNRFTNNLGAIDDGNCFSGVLV